MKHLLILLIHSYQLYFSFLFRGKCIYKESCSNYVLRHCREDGAKGGIKSLFHRVKNCKPGYNLFFNNTLNEYNILTVNGEIIRQSEIKENILF